MKKVKAWNIAARCEFPCSPCKGMTTEIYCITETILANDFHEANSILDSLIIEKTKEYNTGNNSWSKSEVVFVKEIIVR